VQGTIIRDTDNYFKAMRERQYERNRKNVSQIVDQIDSYRKEIQDKLKESETESDKD